MDPVRLNQVEELRKPHPNQRAIDAASAALLRATAPDIVRTRIGGAPSSLPPGSSAPAATDPSGKPR